MKLLLIMPNFFDYPSIITKELKKMGYEVDFFDDRPSTNAWIKAAIRMNPRIVKKYIERYFEKVMQTVREKKYDVIFLISGQSLSFDKNMIAEIKQVQSSARFVLYQWDSIKNFPYIAQVQHFFDKCYSFDREDCESNQTLKFLPLFYCDRYEELGKIKRKNYKYDFCFVGTAHPQKYKFIKLMSEQLKVVYPKQFIYFFFPSPLVFFYRKIVNAELRKASYREFHYIPLTGKEMDELYANSRCVLDSPQAGQLGLTIRVIEALGAKKKLVTTNKDIKNYDFFREENIYVYDGMIDLDDIFFKSDYVDINEDVYKKYSLRSWLEEIIS